MNNFLPIALITILLSPATVKAKSVYLILLQGRSGVDKLEMIDMNRCKKEGEAFKTDKTISAKKSFLCIEV